VDNPKHRQHFVVVSTEVHMNKSWKKKWQLHWTLTTSPQGS